MEAWLTTSTVGSQTLVEVCEPLFQCVCRLNRSARKGCGPDASATRAEVKSALEECRARAGSAGKLEAYEGVEIVLVYFADSMIRRSSLPFAATWMDIAAERGQLAGDEDFFDKLDTTLRDTTDEATERLGVFYTCVGLGFVGWYAGQPEVLRKKMLEMSSRLRGQTDADRSARICPEAYEHVNTADLVEPPAKRMVGVAIVLVGLALTMLGANIALYVDKHARLKASVNEIVKKSGSTASASGGGK